MDPQQLALFGLDAIQAERNAKVNLGFAYLYDKSAQDALHGERDEARHVAASLFRRAGSDFRLIGQLDRAREAYAAAALAYRRMEMPYSVVVATLSSTSLAREYANPEVWRIANPETGATDPAFPQLAYALLAQTAMEQKPIRSDDDRLPSIRDELEQHRHKTISCLGYTVGNILDLNDALLRTTHLRNLGGIVEAMLPFLDRYGSAIKSAMANRYHWSRFALPFQLADSDTLGIIAMASEKLRPLDTSLDRLISDVPIPQLAKVALRVLLE